MKKFLELVLEDILKRHPKGLQDLEIIVPGKRTRTFLKHILSQKINKPLFAPQIITINEFVEQESSLKILENIPAISYLYGTYQNIIKNAESIDRFWYFGEMLLADFDDIDKYMVDAEHIFQYVHDLKEIEQLFGDVEESKLALIKQFWENLFKGTDHDNPEKVKSQFLIFWKHLYSIYSTYKKVLKKAGLGYEGMLYRQVANKAKRNELTFNEKQPVFVGFNALSRAENHIFQAAKMQNGLFYWDFDKWYIDNPHHEAGAFMRENLKNYPSALETDAGFDNLRNIKQVKITGMPGELEMGQKTADIASESFNSSVNPLENGIILGNESLLTPLLQTMHESDTKLNVTMGLPLQNTNIMGLIKNLLQIEHQKKGTAGHIYYKTPWIVELLQQDIVNNAELKTLKKELVEEKRLFCPIERLHNNSLGVLLFPTGKIELIPYLKSILKFIVEHNSNSEDSYHKINIEAAVRIYSSLNQLEQQIKAHNLILPSSLTLRLIDKVLNGINLPLEGEPVMGTQIMGLIEARTLDFDNLIINAVNEGFLPSSSLAPSFIPYNLRKAYGLLTFENQDAIFAYYFYRAIQRCKNLTLIYNSNESDNDYGEQSRFIQQLKFELPGKIDQQTYHHAIAPLQEKSIEIEKNTEVQIHLNAYLSGKRSLFPVHLNTYINCPLKFYLQYIAKIKEPEETNSNIDQRIFGLIFHDTMETLYKPFTESRKPILKQDLETLLNDQTILKHIKESMAQHFGDIDLQKHENGMVSLIEQVVLKYTKRIITNDAENQGFILTGLENQYNTDFTFNGNKHVNLAGKIDRLQQKGSKIFVIDYKTGRAPTQKPRFEDLFSHDLPHRPDAAFQAYLYTRIIASQPFSQNMELIPSLMYIQENRPIQEITFSNRKKQNYTELKKTFDENLENVLSGLFDFSNPFRQTKDSNMCKNCYFKVVCHR